MISFHHQQQGSLEESGITAPAEGLLFFLGLSHFLPDGIEQIFSF